MTKQYDTEEQIEAFDAYVKRNPAGRQVHHTGTLGYEEDEWHAFQEGWNAALAQPAQEPVIVTWDDCLKTVARVWGALDDCTPLPVQEPSACCHACFKASGAMIMTRMILCPSCGNKRCPKASDHRLECTDSNDAGQAGSVYTTPPAAQPEQEQRPWVGLTNDELADLWYKESIDWMEFARAHEAALKEKNT